MPALLDKATNKFVKLLYLGDSGTGKTGSLVSLVQAGYRVRILDLDNGLTALMAQVRQHCPDKAHLVDYMGCYDERKATANGFVVSKATAMPAVTAALDKWEDGSVPSEWGPDTVLVIDSLTALGNAAFNFTKKMNPGAKEPRTWFYGAQQLVMDIIQGVCSGNFATNVIIITHINYQQLTENETKGYPSAIGQAIGPKIPATFDIMFQAEVVGAGKSAVRRIRTLPTGVVDLKNPVPDQIDMTVPLGTGLATLFTKIKELNI